MDQPLYSQGEIFFTPYTQEFNILRYTISVDPLESIPETGTYILSRIHRGIATEAWHVSLGRDIINCSINIHLTPEQITLFTWEGKLSSDRTIEMNNAYGFRRSK